MQHIAKLVAVLYCVATGQATATMEDAAETVEGFFLHTGQSELGSIEVGYGSASQVQCFVVLSVHDSGNGMELCVICVLMDLEMTGNAGTPRIE